MSGCLECGACPCYEHERQTILPPESQLPEQDPAYRVIMTPGILASNGKDLPYSRLGPVLWTAIGVAFGGAIGMVLGALSVR